MPTDWLIGFLAIAAFAAVRALALRTPPTKLSREERRRLRALEWEEMEGDRIEDEEARAS